MTAELVSVITPFYNPGPYLSGAVASVLRQTYCAWELLLVNDGSTDGTAAMAARLAADNDRVRLLSFDDNRGPAEARNAALSETKGDFIAFLDADDEMLTDRLEAQVAYLHAHGAVDVVLGSVEYLMEAGVDPPPWFAERHRRRLPPMTMMARAGVFGRVGGFNPALRHGEDTDWLLRAGAAGTVIVEDRSRVVIRRRFHGGNLTYATAEMETAVHTSVLDIVRNRLAERRGAS